MIDPTNIQIPIYRQCELLGLPRASYYYESQRDDRLVKHTGPGGKSQAGATADAPDGAASHLSEAAPEQLKSNA